MTSEVEGVYGELFAVVAHGAASGRPVIGLVGRDIPSLLVSAAGAQPFRLPPVEQPTDEAYAVMGRAVDRAAALHLAALLSGSLDFLAGILIAHDCEASIRLFYAAQELHRRGRVKVPVHLVDQVHLDRESTRRFNVAQLASMCEVVSGWSASPITVDSLHSARSELSSVRDALLQMRSHRHGPGSRIAGLTAMQCYATASALPPGDALRLIVTAPMTEVDDRLLVFLTGSAPIGDTVYRAIEDSGAVVVGEDHEWGDVILSDVLPPSIPEDREELLRALVQARLQGAPAAASSSMAARARATRAGIQASGAHAVLSIIRTHDDAPAWDWRHQLPLAGVPGLQVRGEAAEEPERLSAAVEKLRVAS